MEVSDFPSPNPFSPHVTSPLPSDSKGYESAEEVFAKPVDQKKAQEIENVAKVALQKLEKVEQKRDAQTPEKVGTFIGKDGYLYFARTGKDGQEKTYCVNEQLGSGCFGEVSGVEHVGKTKHSVLKKHLTLEAVRLQVGANPQDIAQAEHKIKVAEAEIAAAQALSLDESSEARLQAAHGERASAQQDLEKALQVEAKAQEWFQTAQRDLLNDYVQSRRIHGEAKTPLWGIADTPLRLVALTNPETGQEQVGFMARRCDYSYDNTIESLQGITAWDAQMLVESLFECHQLLGGVAYLASQDMAHRDIKANNVLVTQVPNEPGLRRLKLADFGKAFSRQDDTLTLDLPYRDYSTREDYFKALISKNNGDKESFLEQEKKRDAFALGCVLYSRFEGHLPYSGVRDAGDPSPNPNWGWRDISSGKVEERFSSFVPPEIKQIIQGLLAPDSSQRMSAGEAFAQLDQFIKTQRPALYTRMQDLGAPSPENK